MLPAQCQVPTTARSSCDRSFLNSLNVPDLRTSYPGFFGHHAQNSDTSAPISSKQPWRNDAGTCMVVSWEKARCVCPTSRSCGAIYTIRTLAYRPGTCLHFDPVFVSKIDVHAARSKRRFNALGSEGTSLALHAYLHSHTRPLNERSSYSIFLFPVVFHRRGSTNSVLVSTATQGNTCSPADPPFMSFAVTHIHKAGSAACQKHLSCGLGWPHHS